MFVHPPVSTAQPLPLSAFLPGVLHGGELHPGQGSHGGAGPSDGSAQHHQRVPLHLPVGQQRPHDRTKELRR